MITHITRPISLYYIFSFYRIPIAIHSLYFLELNRQHDRFDRLCDFFLSVKRTFWRIKNPLYEVWRCLNMFVGWHRWLRVAVSTIAIFDLLDANWQMERDSEVYDFRGSVNTCTNVIRPPDWERVIFTIAPGKLIPFYRTRARSSLYLIKCDYCGQYGWVLTAPNKSYECCSILRNLARICWKFLHTNFRLYHTTLISFQIFPYPYRSFKTFSF